MDPTTARVLAVAGLLGMFVVFLIIIGLLSGGDGGSDEQEAAVTATATATPEPTETPEPTPTSFPLSPEQELERQEAIDLVASRGFEVVRKRDWNPTDTLKVLIGRTPTGGKMAFFFVNGEYLGNDSTEPSTELRVQETNDLEVALSYGIFDPGDDPEEPTGQPLTVHFRYDGVQGEPVEAVPAPEQRSADFQSG